MVDNSSTYASTGGSVPPTGTEFDDDAPLGGEGVSFDSAASGAGSADPATAPKPGNISQLFKDSAQRLTSDATDRARSYAEDGKARAGGALDELARLMSDAAGTVDEKLGEQYGQYARNAADSVSGFADSLKAKDLDDLIEDARGFVQKSPAIAIGTAAALGFVLVRLIKSGLEGNGTGTGGTGTTGA